VRYARMYLWISRPFFRRARCNHHGDGIFDLSLLREIVTASIRFNPNGRAPPPGNALAFQFSASHRPKTACRNLLRFL
jgi:hypothetical protein